MMFSLIRQEAGNSRKAGRRETEFSRTITMEELLKRHPELIPTLTKRKLHCVGCLLTPFHDISDAAFEHDQDEDELYEALIQAANHPSGSE